MAQTEDIVTFRLPPADKVAIQRLIDKGRFHNRSDFFRYAVKLAIRDALTPAAPPTRMPNLELDAVDLPDAAPASRRRSAPRSQKGVSR